MAEKELESSAVKRALPREMRANKAAARSESSDLAVGYHNMTMMELSKECATSLTLGTCLDELAA